MRREGVAVLSHALATRLSGRPAEASVIDEVERQVGIAPMLAAADDDPTGQQGRVGRAVLDAALPGLDDLQRQEALALACLTRLIASRDHGAPLT